MSTKSSILKFAVRMVISAGVNQIVGNIVQTTTPVDITRVNRILVKIGKLALTDVIGGLIADRVMKEAEEIYTELTTVPKKEEKEPTLTEHPVGMDITQYLKSADEIRSEMMNASSE